MKQQLAQDPTTVMFLVDCLAAAPSRLTAAAPQVNQRRPATAQHSTARHGTARHGTARHGTARHGTARHGTARHNSQLSPLEGLQG
jgi:hypothetical protein